MGAWSHHAAGLAIALVFASCTAAPPPPAQTAAPPAPVAAPTVGTAAAITSPPAPLIPGLGAPEIVAPGLDLYRTTDVTLADGVGPIAVFLLRLDPDRVRIDSVLSNDEVVGAETVDRMAGRNHATAAINGGYFNRDNGEPTGLLKVGGQIVSDASRDRGAVIIKSPSAGKTELTFDQLSVKLTLAFKAAGRDWRVPIDGVDTTRARGKLMLYTPAYHADTDTAPTGTEWVIDGRPLRVIERREQAGRSPIPRAGAVLSFGGVPISEALTALSANVPVTFETSWRSGTGLPADRLDAADAIVNGAGLLRRNGQVVNDWAMERLDPETFTDVRHPRTLIGQDGHGFIWLVAVDGRQPDRSIGMTFGDLERLCTRLGLTGALNLDGGGSTTMVVGGRILNSPSDPGGPRPVSDAIVVTMRD